MDLLNINNDLNLYDHNWRIYSENISRTAQYIGTNRYVKESLIVEGCIIEGEIDHSVLFQGVTIGKNSIIKNSVNNE